jgi:hypothetical protein
MSADGPLPALRVRVPCANEAEYRRDRAARFAESGLFVPTPRAREPGSRVHLKIELLDGSVAYSGDAVVASRVSDGRRTGLVLRLAPAGAAPPPPAAGEDWLGKDLFSVLDEPGGDASPPLPAPARAPVTATAAPAVARDGRAGLEDPSRPDRRAAAPSPAPEPRAEPAPLVRPSTDRAAALRRSALAAGAAVLLVAVAVAAAISLTVGTRRRGAELERAFAEEIRTADVQLEAGRLAGAGADSALGHLQAARALKPGDRRVTSRLQLLRDTLEELGQRALVRGDVEEATAHYRAVLEADPGHATARARLDELAARQGQAQPQPGGQP